MAQKDSRFRIGLLLAVALAVPFLATLGRATRWEKGLNLAPTGRPATQASTSSTRYVATENSLAALGTPLSFGGGAFPQFIAPVPLPQGIAEVAGQQEDGNRSFALASSEGSSGSVERVHVGDTNHQFQAAVPSEIESELAWLDELDALGKSGGDLATTADAILLRRNPFLELIALDRPGEDRAPKTESSDVEAASPAPTPPAEPAPALPQPQNDPVPVGNGRGERAYPFVLIAKLNGGPPQTLGVEKNADGSFYSESAGTIRLRANPYVLGLSAGEIYASADLNGDGLEDLLVAAGSTVVWYLAEPRGLAFGGGIETGRRVSALAADDVTGDGRPDLIVGSGNDVGVWVADGSGFDLARVFSADTLVGSVATVQGEAGRNDIIVLSRFGGELFYFENLGGRNFQRTARSGSFPPESVGSTRWDYQGVELVVTTVITGRQAVVTFSADGLVSQRISVDITRSFPVVVLGDHFGRGEPVFLFYY
ncbi:MAG: FG-GAP repeat domain-containing protein [Acidobacteriota bacterium]